MSRLARFTLALLLAGCNGTTIDELCADLSARCQDLDAQECIDDGEQLKTQAESVSCRDEFDHYVECVEDTLCDWYAQCAQSRADLDACLASRG